MRRREFIKLITGAVAAPSAALGQQLNRGHRIPSIGILNYASADDVLVNEFRGALAELGRVEGQSLTISYRWADGHFERLPGLAAELVASNVDVIIALGPATWAAKAATNNVPIVIAFSGDPVGNGVVSNLARPGGNITGFSYMSTDLAGKRIELLARTFPKNRRIGILYNPAEPATKLEMQHTEAAARAAAREEVDGLIVFTHGFAVLNRKRIVAQAASRRLPTMYGWREFVDEGGLMSYGPNVPVMVRKAASYVDRIIKGEKPGDLPIEQPARLELVLNLKTAKALSLDIPPALLAVADAVIE